MSYLRCMALRAARLSRRPSCHRAVQPWRMPGKRQKASAHAGDYGIAASTSWVAASGAESWLPAAAALAVINEPYLPKVPENAVGRSPLGTSAGSEQRTRYLKGSAEGG